jgi:hypothetical protein
VVGWALDTFKPIPAGTYQRAFSTPPHLLTLSTTAAKNIRTTRIEKKERQNKKEEKPF